MCRVFDWLGVPNSVLLTNQRLHGDILTIRACLRLPSRPRAYPKFFEAIGYLPISSSPPARGGPGHLGVSCPVCVLHAGEQTGENVSSINFSIFSENPGKEAKPHDPDYVPKITPDTLAPLSIIIALATRPGRSE